MEVFSPLMLQRFIYLTLNRYLLTSHFVPGIVPSAENLAVSQTDKDLALYKHTF